MRRTPIDTVVRWRVQRLRTAGLGAESAETLAEDPAYDLHALLELVDRGCPPDVAVRILAPLESEERC
ncbi:MAG: hypothetical protein ACR2HD_01255 [Solirubrobacteraceae bacterium]|nr:MAG: hypothetical protein DLM63_04515 [Solirubrobacterales bacterium]